MPQEAIALADSLRASGLIDDLAPQLKAIETKKVSLMDSLIELIEDLDPAERSSWRPIVVAAGEAGVTDEDIQTELGTSPSTIYRWRNDDAAPKAGTRKLMRDALVGLIEQRRARFVHSD